MSTNNTIPGVAVEVSADWSDLTSGLDSVISQLESAGSTISEEVDGWTSKTTNAFDPLVESAGEAAKSVAEVDAAVKASADAMGPAQAAAEGLAGEEDALTGSVRGAGEATSQASRYLQQFTENQQYAAQATEEARTPLEEFTETIGTMHEAAEAFVALAFVEKLKEIGDEALNTYGAAQRVETSFELMTGSASQASDAMEELQGMAVSLGIPLGQLEQAAQRASVVFGVGEGLTEALNAAANAAAASGQSFDSVMQALQRVEQTGMLSTRQITQMGLSWADVATQMGVSIADAQALMKSGGQTAEQDVEALIATINAKFGQAAQAQAQGVLGQFTSLKDQVELVFEQIGAAIAPAVTLIVQVFENAIIPAINAVINAFRALPQPLQDFTVLLGIAVTAAAGLAGVIATLVFAFRGLQTFLAAAETLFVALTGAEVAETGAAEADTVATLELAAAKRILANVSGTTAEAEVGMAAAAEGGGTALGALSTAAGLFVTVAAPMALAFLQTQQNVTALKDKWGELDQEVRTRTIIDAMNAGQTIEQIKLIGYTVDQLKSSINGMGISAGTVFQQLQLAGGPVKDALQQMGYTTDQVAKSLIGVQQNGVTAFTAIQHGATLADLTDYGFKVDVLAQKFNSLAGAAAQSFSSVASGITVVDLSFPKVSQGVTDVATAVAKLEAEVVRTNAVMQLAAQNNNGDAESLRVLQAATQDHEKAVNALNAALGIAKNTQADYILGLTSMAGKQADATADFDAATAALKRADAAFVDGQINMQTYTGMWQQASQAAKAAGQTLQDASYAVASLTQTAQTQIAALSGLVDTYNKLEQQYEGLKAVGAETTVAQLALADGLNKVQSAAHALGLEVDAVDGKLQFVVADGKKATDASQALADKFNGGALAAKQFSGGLQDLIDKVQSVSDEVTRSTYVYKEALVAYGKGLITYPVLTQALKDMQAAQKAFDDEQGYASQLYDASTTKIIGLKGEITNVTDAMRGLTTYASDGSGAIESFGNAAMYAVQHSVPLREAINELNQSYQDAARNGDAAANAIVKAGDAAAQAGGQAKAAANDFDALWNAMNADSMGGGFSGGGGRGGGGLSSPEAWTAWLLSIMASPLTSMDVQGNLPFGTPTGSPNPLSSSFESDLASGKIQQVGDNYVVAATQATQALTTTTAAVSSLGSAASAAATKATDLNTVLAASGPTYDDATNAAVNAINSGTAAVLDQTAALNNLNAATQDAAMQITDSTTTIGLATDTLLPTIAAASTALASSAGFAVLSQIALAPGGGGNIDLSSMTYTPGNGTGTLPLTLQNNGIVVGSNGMAQLADMVQQAVLKKLQQTQGLQVR